MADDSRVPGDARLAQSTKKPAVGGTKETDDAQHRRKTADAVDQGPTRPSRPLTIQQKRIFVLGLGAREKN